MTVQSENTDAYILGLFSGRDQRAIAEAEKKYGAYCRSVVGNILSDERDVEECMSDVWMKAWSSLPGRTVGNLGAYLAALSRNEAIGYYRRNRRGGEYPILIDELSEVLDGTEGDPEKEALDNELTDAVNAFLRSLSERDCDIFLCRYFFAMPVSAISAKYRMKENYVRNVLSRTAVKLKKYLKKEKLI